MEHTINEQILRITGTANLEKGLEFDKTYRIDVEVDINKVSSVNREDGTKDMVYSAKMITATIFDEKEAIKTKDKKRRSQKMRASLMYLWQQESPDEDFEQFYDRTMATFNANLENIYNYFCKN